MNNNTEITVMRVNTMYLLNLPLAIIHDPASFAMKLIPTAYPTPNAGSSDCNAVILLRKGKKKSKSFTPLMMHEQNNNVR